MFGGISKVFFILSCSQGTKLSIRMSTVTSWEVMPHPPFSPDLAPSDYYLFSSLQNHLNGKTFFSTFFSTCFENHKKNEMTLLTTQYIIMYNTIVQRILLTELRGSSGSRLDVNTHF